MRMMLEFGKFVSHQNRVFLQVFPKTRQFVCGITQQINVYPLGMDMGAKIFGLAILIRMD